MIHEAKIKTISDEDKRRETRKVKVMIEVR